MALTYSTQTSASGLQVHHIVLDLLGGLALLLQEFDCDMPSSIVNKEEIILVSIYGLDLIFPPKIDVCYVTVDESPREEEGSEDENEEKEEEHEVCRL